MTAPHRVQNLSLGSASFPHSAQVHPVRRKRTSRALIRSPPPDGPLAGDDVGAIGGIGGIGAIGAIGGRAGAIGGRAGAIGGGMAADAGGGT
jgi:hypothetical protein